MSAVLEQIDEIEKAAREIVRHAQDDKQVIEDSLQKSRIAFENRLHESTRGEIETIRKNSEKQMKTLLAEQNRKYQNIMDTLEERFGKYEKAYAAEIVKKIIEV